MPQRRSICAPLMKRIRLTTSRQATQKHLPVETRGQGQGKCGKGSNVSGCRLPQILPRPPSWLGSPVRDISGFVPSIRRRRNVSAIGLSQWYYLLKPFDRIT